MALSSLFSCSKIEAWQEKEVTYPNRVHYSVATSEIVEEKDGVCVINSSLLRYDISLYDDNSLSRGSLSIVAARDAQSFAGTYCFQRKTRPERFSKAPSKMKTERR